MKHGYLISSHARYSAPLEVLLRSMTGIEPQRIFIAVGGSSEETLRVSNGRLIAHCKHNSFDHTASIEFLRYSLRFPARVFLLHDTMEFTAETDALVSAAPHKWAVAASSGSGGGQCNLLSLDVEYLRRSAPALHSLRDCSKYAAIMSEGMLWKQCPEEHRAVYPGESCEVVGRSRPYDGAERLVEMYGGVKLRKFKANWGQDNSNGVVVP